MRHFTWPVYTKKSPSWVLSPADERKLTFLKRMFFIPGSTALILNSWKVIIKLEPTRLDCSNPAIVAAVVLHTPCQKCPKLTKFETLSLYIHPKAIDPAKPTPGTCSELPNEPSCKKQSTQIALSSFWCMVLLTTQFHIISDREPLLIQIFLPFEILLFCVHIRKPVKYFTSSKAMSFTRKFS